MYDEVSLTMFHESEIQDALASRSELVFPGYKYCAFNPFVSLDEESAQPDFVLIESGYRKWYVGEVEMVRHDLTGHVLRQVRIFKGGEYTEEHVRHILRRQPAFDEARLRLLVETVPPGIMVVADKMDEAWRSAIRSEGARMAVFEVFRRQHPHELLFRVNGDMPELPNALISNCQFDRSMQRLLRVFTPAGIPATNGDRLTIRYEGVLSEWIFMVAEDKAWLNPAGHVNLPQESVFALLLGPDNTLTLEAKRHAVNRWTRSD